MSQERPFVRLGPPPAGPPAPPLSPLTPSELDGQDPSDDGVADIDVADLIGDPRGADDPTDDDIALANRQRDDDERARG